LSVLFFIMFGVNSVLADESELTQLEDLVVTATRTESSMEKIGGGSVTVIRAEDIDVKQMNTVADVLKEVPGIDVVSNGGLGALSNVSIRGADVKNTLVLVDGVIYNDISAINGVADLSSLTLENIERIEVVRGPMSVLYGSKATAGIINIITKKGKGKPSVHAGYEYGSYNTWKAYGGASGAINKFNFSLSASRTETDGFSAADDDNDKIPHAGNTSEEDGWENTSVSGLIGLEITPDFDISANLRYLDSELEYDDFAFGAYAGDRFTFDEFYNSVPDPDGLKKLHQETEQIFSKINIHNYFFDRFFESTFSYQNGKTERNYFDNDGADNGDYTGETEELAWQGGLNFQGMDVLSFGATWLEETIDSKWSDIDNQAVETKSFWAQNQLFLGEGFVLTAGVRNDDHENFGNETTYRIAPSYTFSQTNTTLKASYGTGFRAPTVDDLLNVDYGNEDLEPERSKGWDVGFEQGLAENKIKFGLTYFRLDFDDRIAWDSTLPGPWGGRMNNFDGTTKTQGVESFVKWMPTADLDFQINYTYTDTEDPDGERLARRPLNKVYFNARYRWLEKAVFNLDAYWVDEADASNASDKDGNPVDTLDAYTLVNVSASYDICEYVQIYGRIDNVFDEYYEEAWSYATPGLSAYAGIKVSY